MCNKEGCQVIGPFVGEHPGTVPWTTTPWEPKDWGWEPKEKLEQPCPTCGRCPTCGHHEKFEVVRTVCAGGTDENDS